MDQLRRLFLSLSVRQTITLAAAAAAVAGGLVYFQRWNNERSFHPIYSGLAAEDASGVVAKLREGGVEYRLTSDGGTVLVRSDKIADLRLLLASAGLPKSGRIGFELFDKTNFGATDFVEQVNYHRALEGELERSVMSIAEVERARVHITRPKQSVFLESRQPAKASVLLKLRLGARLAPANVLSIAHLVASAVEGLAPERVSIMDMRGNLLSRPRPQLNSDGSEPSGAMIEYRQSIERDLLAKISNTVEPLLGSDKFRAGVSVECDFTSGEKSEETFDPERSEMAWSRRTGNISYQASRTVRHTKLPQGSVQRISVSLLVDHAVRFEGEDARQKRIVEPIPAERLKAIKDLVAGAVGLKPDRGDQIVVESLLFESTATWAPSFASPVTAAPVATLAAPKWLSDAIGRKDYVILGALAGRVLAVAIATFTLILMVRGRKKKIAVSVAMQPAIAGAAPAAGNENALLEKAEATLDLPESLTEPLAATRKGQLLSQHLNGKAAENPGFDTLQKADPQQLAKFIHSEHPQTIALVLSHLNPSRAAALLFSLPSELRAEAALRMAHLDQISPDVITRIAGIIGTKLKALGEFSRESYGGVKAVSEMFNRLDSSASKELLEDIEKADPALVEHIRHLMFVFEDLLLIDANAIKEILARVDRKVLTIALKGASDQLKQHFLSNMSQRGAEMTRQDMVALGPITSKEVEGSQQQIVAVVRQLEGEGVISLDATVGEQYVV